MRRKRVRLYAPHLGVEQDSDGPIDTTECEETTDRKKMNLVGSKLLGTDEIAIHMPVLDFDFPVYIKESETPGHFHVFLEKEMTWETYEQLLRDLEIAGLLQAGFVNTSIARKMSAVALRPWKNKGK